MKEAIKITESEIEWHKANKSESPTLAHADGFIKGMEHLLYIFEQAENHQQKDSVNCKHEWIGLYGHPAAYECKKCDVIFEVFQRITEDPIKDCPECGSAVKKLISSGMGIIFKGSGFYSTDNKNRKSNASQPEKAAAENSKSEKSKEKKESISTKKKPEEKKK